MNTEKNNKNNNLNLDIIAFPKSGGVYSGSDMTFQTEDFSGSISVNVPIYTSPCRNIEPKLNLKYNSSCSNGSFGMGFSLNIPFISRNPENCIPTYKNNTDVFISSEYGELIKVDEYKKDGYMVILYREVTEKSFSKIEFFTSHNNDYWKTTTKNNDLLIFGYSNNAKIKNNSNNNYRWFLEQFIDKNGNKISYEYIEDNENRYIGSIKYGNYFDENKVEKFILNVIFSYSNRDDNYVGYRSGFPIFTNLLCNKISMVHNFKSEKIIRETIIKYDFSQNVALISEISEIGYSYNNGNVISKNCPPIHFEYTHFKPKDLNFKKLDIKNKNISETIERNHYNFIDLYGDGIEGILYNINEALLYFRPLGNGLYDEPEIVKEFPIDKDIEKYTLTSLEGNGKYDLVAELGNRIGFYEINKNTYDNFVPFEKCPNQYNNIYREFSDLQGDGLRHLFFSSKNKILYYPSLKKEGFEEPIKTIPPKDFPEYMQNYENVLITFLDIFGDGILHRVKAGNGYVDCWPNFGYGKFGEKISIENAPYFEDNFDISRLFFADLDGNEQLRFN